MASHSDLIIAQVQQEVQALLTYVTGPVARTHSAYTVELTLFRRLLALGRILLRLFFITRAAVRPAAPTGPDGEPFAYHDRRSVTYYSVFGKLSFQRHAFIAVRQPVVCPLDAELSLPARCYSDLLREWATFGATDGSYGQTQTLLARILGLSLSEQALETSVAEDATDVTAFYEQAPDLSARPPEATILVAQADGKGVPMVQPPAAPAAVRPGKGQKPGTKKEALVTAVYTIAPYPRTPAMALVALMQETERTAPDLEATPRPAPVGKEVRATLAGKEAALTGLAARAAQHAGPHIQQRVALTDGAETLQQQMRTHLPDHTLVLDIIHAVEHLWEAANGLLGERHPERSAWVAARLEHLLLGQTQAVIAGLSEQAADQAMSARQQDLLRRTAGYYQRNAPFMCYPDYLARGWPIGTGVVEGACGHLVKDRCEQAGMRWTQAGAQAVLDLRAVRLNGDWDRYWTFHRQQCHTRRYGGTATASTAPETQALAA